MTGFINNNFYILVIVLLLLCFFLLLLILRRGKKGTQRLESDSTGLWKYNKETQYQKKRAYSARLENKKEKKSKENKALAVINFDGDLRAKQHSSLAKLVDEVLLNKENLTEVVVTVSSPGGMVSQYGHAFSQMERIRKSGIKLTVCVDVVAASGGYLMSLPADKIIAAPFAIVGSVGVMAFVPNIRKFLLKNNIEPRTFTAGKFKRPVGLTDDASKDDIKHFEAQLETVHQLFLGAVRKYRPHADFSQIETGDHWHAQESIDKNLGLVDEISTSHDYLLEKNKLSDLVFFSQKKGRFDEGVFKFVGATADVIEERLFLFIRGGV